MLLLQRVGSREGKRARGIPLLFAAPRWLERPRYLDQSNHVPGSAFYHYFTCFPFTPPSLDDGLRNSPSSPCIRVVAKKVLGTPASLRTTLLRPRPPLCYTVLFSCTIRRRYPAVAISLIPMYVQHSRPYYTYLPSNFTQYFAYLLETHLYFANWYRCGHKSLDCLLRIWPGPYSNGPNSF